MRCIGEGEKWMNVTRRSKRKRCTQRKERGNTAERARQDSLVLLVGEVWLCLLFVIFSHHWHPITAYLCQLVWQESRSLVSYPSTSTEAEEEDAVTQTEAFMSDIKESARPRGKVFLAFLPPGPLLGCCLTPRAALHVYKSVLWDVHGVTMRYFTDSRGKKLFSLPPLYREVTAQGHTFN